MGDSEVEFWLSMVDGWVIGAGTSFGGFKGALID